MIEETISLVERQYEFLKKQDGIHFFFQLKRFLEFLDDHPLTSSVLSDLASKNQVMLNDYRDHEIKQIRKLKRIRNEIKKKLPKAWISKGRKNNEDLPEELDFSPEAFDRIVLKPPFIQIPGVSEDWEDPSRIPLLSKIIISILDDYGNKRKGTKRDWEYAKSVEKKIGLMEEEHNYRYREWIYDSSSGSACSLLRLSFFVARVNPEPDFRWHRLSVREKLEFASREIFSIGAPITSVMRGQANGDDHKRFSSLVADAKNEAEKLVEDLVVRIGEKRMIHGLFEKFKMKCEWFIARNLRALAERGSGKPEDRLSEKAAEYLFELGLIPIIKPILGRLEPDIVSLSSRWMVYVEVKQYKNSRGRGIIKKGAKQVWDTAGRLKELGIRESFLLVFRRSGPRYALPKVVTSEGIRLFPILIDISSSKVSGSRQRYKPITIKEEEFIS